MHWEEHQLCHNLHHQVITRASSVAQILNYVAGGRDVSANITFMCQTIMRGPAAPLVKKLAYDVVHAAPLSDSDWALVIEGLRSDIVGTFSLEVTAFIT